MPKGGLEPLGYSLSVFYFHYLNTIKKTIVWSYMCIVVHSNATKTPQLNNAKQLDSRTSFFPTAGYTDYLVLVGSGQYTDSLIPSALVCMKLVKRSTCDGADILRS